MKKELKQSQTTTIRRSRIRLNPWNPKRHKDEEVRRQLANFRRNGFLGGILWNSVTGNLVDGHRRVQALDIFYRYDGTPETDYDLKVEAVEFDEKTEKEQLTYMAVGNTKADYNLIARYAPDIDPRSAGLTDEDYRRIMDLVDGAGQDVAPMRDLGAEFLSPLTDLRRDVESSEDIMRRHEEKPKMTKEQVKAEKAHCDDVASSRQDTQDLYVFLSFVTLSSKQAFCDLLGYLPENSMLIRGEDVLKLIE